MIALEPIKWQPEPGEFRGEIGASVRLSAGRWQELGRSSRHRTMATERAQVSLSAP